MKIRTLATTLALTLAFGFGLAQAQPIPGTSIDDTAGTELGMEAQNASGEIGTVTLFKRGAKTLVVLDIKSAPASAQPAHIHRGTCENLNPAPIYPLSNVVNGKSKTLVAAPIDKLLSGNYSVNVHKSAQNLKLYVSCGHLHK